jgi:nickel-dependent lactate racemase
VDRAHTVPDQWESQVLARILNNHHVIIVSDMVDPVMVRNMHMEPVKTFDEAMNRAYELQGQDARVTVIPEGLAVVVR